MDVLIRALQRAGSNTAIAVQRSSCHYTYNGLLHATENLAESYARQILPVVDKQYAPRVGCLADPGSEYVVGMWSAWLQGYMFVPLAPAHPMELLQYEMDHARLSTVRTHVCRQRWLPSRCACTADDLSHACATHSSTCLLVL